MGSYLENKSNIKDDIDLDSEEFIESYAKKQFLKNLQMVEYSDEDELISLTTERTMIVHFFNSQFKKSIYMNKALQALPVKFPKIKFVCIDVRNCPKMCSSLKIKVLPFVAFFKDGFYVDQLIGFEKLGNKEYFELEDLEYFIMNSNIMNALE